MQRTKFLCLFSFNRVWYLVIFQFLFFLCDACLVEKVPRYYFSLSLLVLALSENNMISRLRYYNFPQLKQKLNIKITICVTTVVLDFLTRGKTKY